MVVSSTSASINDTSEAFSLLGQSWFVTQEIRQSILERAGYPAHIQGPSLEAVSTEIQKLSPKADILVTKTSVL